jgi:hypothetical protein
VRQSESIEAGIAALVVRCRVLRRRGFAFGIAAAVLILIAWVIHPSDLGFEQGFGTRVIVPRGIEISDLSLRWTESVVDWSRLELPAFLLAIGYMVFVTQRFYGFLGRTLRLPEPVSIIVLLVCWLTTLPIVAVGWAWPLYKAYQYLNETFRLELAGRIGFFVVAIPASIALPAIILNGPQFVAYAIGTESVERQLVLEGYIVKSGDDSKEQFTQDFEARLLADGNLTAEKKDMGWYVLAQHSFVDSKSEQVGPYLAHMTGAWHSPEHIHNTRILYMIAYARAAGFRGNLHGAGVAGGRAVWALPARIIGNAFVAALIICILLSVGLLVVAYRRSELVRRLEFSSQRLTFSAARAE